VCFQTNNTVESLHDNLIHSSARHGYSETIARQLEHSDINTTDRHGQTALHVAVSGNEDAVFYRLINNRSINPDIQDEDGNTALMIAVKLEVNGMISFYLFFYIYICVYAC